MKKILFAASILAITVAGLSSCGKSTSVSPEDKAFDDSMAVCWGYMVGGQANQMLLNTPDGSKIDKAAFIRGVQTALMLDSADRSYLQGLSLGVNIAQQRIYAIKELGTEIDPDLWMKEFKKSFMADSVPVDQREMTAMFNVIVQKAEKRAQERKEAELSKSPESLANIAAGEAFIDSLKKADPAVQTTESGLSYKIENPGEGTDSIMNTTRMWVNYTGRFTDGTVFDQSKEAPVRFTPGQVVPGFGEGLKMLQKGGKATFYIPGKLGYGANGQPMAGIGPNQMLIFDVEIVSVNEAPAPAK